MFQFRHHNRLIYPQKHVLICEDDLSCQRNILDHFNQVFDHQGIVQFSVVCGGIAAASIMSSVKIDAILLDHDMPEGNGTDLLNWMKEKQLNIPVITFSGIPQNNTNMMVLGATHLFGKGEVIEGAADELLKEILGLKTGIAEHYMNTVSLQTSPMVRYWITKKILVGGNITSADDWSRLKRIHGIKAVINVDGGHSERAYGIDDLFEFHVNDEGDPFPVEYVREVVKFAKKHSDHPIYVHCHVGASRSPHFVYAILRGLHKMSKEDALATVMAALPYDYHRWGFNSHTASYVKSIEEALANWDVQVI